MMQSNMKQASCIYAFRKRLLIFIALILCLKFLVILTPIPIGLEHSANTKQKVFDLNGKEIDENDNAYTGVIIAMPLKRTLNEKHEKLPVNYAGYHNQFVTLTRPRGRLGNQMFQLASLIGIGDTYNYVPAIVAEKFKDIFYIFKEPSNETVEIDSRSSHVCKEPDADLFEERDVTQFSEQNILKTRGNWTIDGYYQSYKHFNNVSNKVRGFFNFKDKFIGEARKFFEKNKLTGTVVIGMHIRRGDFLSQYHQSLGRTTVDADYIRRAMDFYRSWYKSKITFLVFSNDIIWCKESIRDPHNAILFSTYDHPGYDLALMSLCDHMIMSVGTFGWWGGWLSGGHVVYFKGYPRPGSEIDKYFNKDDFYPPEWTGLE